MRYLAALMLACVLSACATYSDVQGRTPTHAADTSRLPQPVAECVASKWMDTNASTHISPDGDNRVVVMPTGGGAAEAVLMTLTASRTEQGSHVEMRTSPSLGKFDKQWDQVKACL